MAPHEQLQEPQIRNGISKGGNRRDHPQAAQPQGGCRNNSQRGDYRKKR